MNWRAVKASAGLAVLFVVVYSTTNWLSSLRTDVGILHWAWERHIPFVPLFILPYMSIDLFFIAAPFACRSDQERRTLVRRIAAAILIAGVCFLLFPLRFDFERPVADGWLGAMFNRFREYDLPYNQLPSLHVALGTILLAFYAGRIAGAWRFLVCAWFTLITLSAVLTYQHHAIDVAGGMALAGWCLYTFPSRPEPAPINRRIGAYYIAGALALGACTLLARPWSVILTWPALSLLCMGIAYFGIGAGIFRKADGRLPLATRLALWPVLLGQRLSLIYYSRQCRLWDRLTEGILIGRRLSDAQARAAIDAGVTAVLDLAPEFSEAHPFRALPYCHLPVLDLTAPTPAQLEHALEFIEQHSARGTIYVHCKIGYSRTAAVAGAYLLATGAARSVDEAMAMLRAARPSIVIRPEARAALVAYQARVATTRAVFAPA